MAKKASIPQLDAGFEEVPLENSPQSLALDDGFEEVPLQASKAPTPMSKQDTLSMLQAPPKSMDGLLGKETSKDLSTGAKQGLTFGFADEIDGGVTSFLDKLKSKGHDLLPGMIDPSLTQQNAKLKAEGFTGDIGPSNSEELYRQTQQDHLQDYKNAQERSPIATTVGEVGGAIASGIGTAGLTGLGSGAKAASGIGKILSKFGLTGLSTTQEIQAAMKAAKLAGNLDEVAALKSMLSTGQKVGASAARIAGAGAELIPEGIAYGAGTSEGKLLNATPEEKDLLVDDTIEGAKTASLLGAGLRLGGELGSVTGNKIKEAGTEYLKDSPFVRQFLKAGKQGMEGISYSSEKDIMEKLAPKAQKSSSDLLERINRADSALGKAVGDSIENANKQGILIDVSEPLRSAALKAEQAFVRNPAINIDPKAQKTMSKILSKSSAMTPDELRTARDHMGDILDQLRGDNSTVANQTRKIVQDYQAGIVSQLKESIPDYKLAAERFAEFRRSVPETILSKGRGTDITGIRVGDLKNPDLKLSTGIEEMLEGVTKPVAAADDAKNTFVGLRDRLGELEQSEAQRASQAASQNKPFQSIFDLLGTNKEDLLQGIKDTGDELSAVSLARGAKPSISGAKSGMLQAATGGGAPVKGTAIALSNLGGRAIGGASKIVKSVGDATGATKLANISKNMYKATDDTLRGHSERLLSNPKTQSLGNALRNAIENKNVGAKNAIIFSILQNPDARPLVDEETDEQFDQ